jgi:hypothetical protein
MSAGMKREASMNTSASEKFRTEFPFTLPKGYLDGTGVLHRHGVMRLATAADEILPQRDPRVQQNQAYLAVIVLARVLVKLGDVPHIDTSVVEGLFAADFDFLQRLYEQLNDGDEPGRADGRMPVQNGHGSSKGFGVLGEV